MRQYFIEAFYDREELIKEHKLTVKLHYKDIDWVQYRKATKHARLTLTDAIRNYVTNYRLGVEKKQNDGRYYMHYTKLIYKKLNIDIPKGANPRDVLDKKTLARLTALEYDVADRIEELAKKGMHYKDVFYKIKDELLK